MRLGTRHLRRHSAASSYVLWLVAAIPFLLSSCAEQMPQNTLDPAGEGARDIANLIVPVFVVAGVIFVVVQTVLLVSVVRFRDRGDSAETAPKQTHGHTPLEVVWTIIPFLILVVIAIPTVRLIWKQHTVPKNAGILEVKVTGHQWWWEYEYPNDGVRTANELHIPAGRDVKLTLTSVDVVHSFWIPRLAGKQDVIPGKERVLVLRADRPESEPLFGQCVEFCGISHANMRLRAVVQSEADFEAWLEAQRQPAATPQPGSKAAEGQRVFETGACIGCHTIAGTNAQGRVGPDLTHLASRSTFAGSMFDLNGENLSAWLHDPPAAKPGTKMPNLGLSDSDVESLVAYLQSLK
jgi:cytochrome c oxidase subunit 2